MRTYEMIRTRSRPSSFASSSSSSAFVIVRHPTNTSTSMQHRVGASPRCVCVPVRRHLSTQAQEYHVRSIRAAFTQEIFLLIANAFALKSRMCLVGSRYVRGSYRAIEVNRYRFLFFSFLYAPLCFSFSVVLLIKSISIQFGAVHSLSKPTI